MLSQDKNFDVIIIGGSYSGLSAAMSLGRALRQVLIIDSGEPCNRQTPHSHNFLTQDGRAPGEIASVAKEQVLRYSSVEFHEGFAAAGRETAVGFEIVTSAGETFTTKKLIVATGIKDIMPDIEGFAECWGISAIHCPYCHGYEYKSEPTGIIGNGDIGFHLGQMISNWTKELTLFTNGKSALSPEQTEQLGRHQVEVIESKIERLDHRNGQIQDLVLKGGRKIALNAVYARPDFVQHSGIPAALGCEPDEQGLLKVDPLRRTSVPGVFACGDNSSPFRSLGTAVQTGSMAGAAVSKELIEEEF